MKLGNAQLTRLAEQYVRALEGSEVLEAIQIQASKANISTEYIKFSGLPVNVVLKIFKTAQAQEKLFELLNVIKEENINISIPTNFNDGLSSRGVDYSTYRNWLRSETEYVDIRGIGRRESREALTFPILKLYTELYIRLSPSNLPGRARSGSNRISLSQMVEATRCLAITGDPGSGKTTFLRYIARKYIVDEKEPLPILLRLSDVYDHAKLKPEALAPYAFIDFCLELSSRENLNLDKDDLLRKVKAGEILWLLDSLDELPTDEIRENMVEVIDRATQRWDKCRFVLTSRPLPVRSKSIPIQFTRVEIDAWTETEIGSFLQAWTSLLYYDVTEEMRRRHWGNLLTTIMERPDLRSLAKNAVMVTAIAVVHYNDKKLPEGRAALLQALLDWLIHAKNRAYGAKYITPKFIEDKYREIALAMLEAPEGRKRRVGRLWAAEIIAKYFDGGIQEALEFLSREEAETGILIRRGEGDLEFWHLSFQEYLAAKEIAGKTDDPDKGWWAKVKPNLDKTSWKEVLLFIPACLNQLGSDRVDLFFERLGESCLKADLPKRARRIALGGNIFRDLRLAGYTPDNISTWSKALSSILPILDKEGESIPLEIRYEALIAYGLGGDERLREFETTWICIPLERFMMGAQAVNPEGLNYDPDAAPWEGPVLELSLLNFEIRKYPITVQEFEPFVDEGYHNQKFWTLEEWAWVQKEKINLPLDWDEQKLSPNCPITGISWYEADAYCNWLTTNDRLGYAYHLPREADWEYVAKRGLKSGQHFPWGNSISVGDNVEANFAWSGLRKKTPVGMFWKCVTIDGIFDMFGNVEEWCADKWTPDHQNYPNGDLEWKEKGENPRMVVKGGSTIRFSRLCRPTYRSRIRSQSRYPVVGFRPIRRKSKSDE